MGMNHYGVLIGFMGGYFMARITKIGCWIAVTLLSMALFWSVILNIGLLSVFFRGNNSEEFIVPVDEEPEFEEVWSYGYGDTKVVRIELTGTIERGGQERLLGRGPDMVESVLAQIQAASNDPYVRAIVLEVDSPGGAITPSDEIYAALRLFKEVQEDRKILVFIRDLGASGAYYAAMAGDYIMAEPTSLVGSVGVIMQSLNIKELGDKLGLRSVTIASGTNKDMLNPLKEVNPGHVEMLQGLVDEMQDRFASIVMESRGLDSRDLLDGRVFTAQQALEHGLIDRIGYWQEAVEELRTLLEVEDLFMVRYTQEVGFLDALLGAASTGIPGLNAIESPRLLYQWKP